MTLCIVWPNGDHHISLASDSRLNVGHGQYLDVGVKIVPIDVGFLVPPQGGQGAGARPNGTLALATAGSLITAHAVRETVQIAVRRIQLPPFGRDFALADVLNVATEFFQRLARSTCDVLAETGVAHFALAGFEPRSRITRAFEVTLDTTCYPITATWREIRDSDFPLLLGSGVGSARRILSQAPETNPLQLIRQICEDPTTPSVGGSVQHARVGPDGYVTFGVCELEVDHSARTFRLHYRIAGLEIDPHDFYDKRLPQPSVSYSVLQSDEIASLRRAGYREL